MRKGGYITDIKTTLFANGGQNAITTILANSIKDSLCFLYSLLQYK